MAKKTKTAKRFLTVLLIILIALTAVCIWQKENITAIIEGFTMSEGDISKRSEEDTVKVNTYLKKNNLTVVRDLTTDEQQALVQNEISDNQAVKIMKGEITLDEAKTEKSSSEQSTVQNSENSNNQQISQNENEAPKQNNNISDTDYDSHISDLVAQVYVIKARFTSSLRNLEATVCDEFYGQPESEWTKNNKARIIKKYTQTALDMQSDCDSQMEQVLAQLKKLLEAAGRDESIINTIKTSYDNEKKATKSMYIKKYLD